MDKVFAHIIALLIIVGTPMLIIGIALMALENRKGQTRLVVVRNADGSTRLMTRRTYNRLLYDGRRHDPA